MYLIFLLNISIIITKLMYHDIIKYFPALEILNFIHTLWVFESSETRKLKIIVVINTRLML